MRAHSFAFVIISAATWSCAAHAEDKSPQELSQATSVVSRYCNAWSETDSAKRDFAVEEVWAERGEYLDSQPAHAIGRKAIAAEIVKFQQQFPGAHFRCSAIRAHHGFVGYTWSMVMGDGTERFRGRDFGEINSEGRLVRIVSFFDMQQSAR